MFLKINDKIIVFAFEQLLKGIVWKCGSKMTETFQFSRGSLLSGIHPKRINLYKLFSIEGANGPERLFLLRNSYPWVYLLFESELEEFPVDHLHQLSFYSAKVSWGRGCVGYFAFIL